MKIYNLSFLWCIPIIAGLYSPFLSCNGTPDSPKASVLGDSMQNQKKVQTRTGNIVLRSADNGQTWVDISEGLPKPMENNYGAGRNFLFTADNSILFTAANGIYHSKPNSIAPFWTKENLPNNLNSIAAGKEGLYAYNYGEEGIFQKNNGTDVWLPIFTNFTEKQIFNVFETTGGTVFIGSFRGLFKSSNRGKSWKQLTVGGGGKMVESNGVLLVTGEAGILRSTDDGENWSVVISEGGVGIDVAVINGGFAAINYSNVSKTRRIRASYDGGITWKAIDAGLQIPGFLDPILPSLITNSSLNGNSDSNQHPVETAAVNEPTYLTSIIQVGENFFCGHTFGIYKSTDKGKTWELVRCADKGKMFLISVSGNMIYAIQTVSHC